MKKVTKREWILLGGALTLAFMVWLSDAIQRQPFDDAADDLRKLNEQIERDEAKYQDMLKQYNTPKK